MEFNYRPVSREVKKGWFGRKRCGTTFYFSNFVCVLGSKYKTMVAQKSWDIFLKAQYIIYFLFIRQINYLIIVFNFAVWSFEKNVFIFVPTPIFFI